MDETNFDLRAFLADRAYPTSKIRVLLSEKLAFEIAALEHKIAGITNKEELKQLETDLAKLYEQRQGELFTFHLRGVSRRKREDIQSKGMSQIPYKFDMYGRDDPTQQVARQKLVEELLFHAYITQIDWPSGKVQAVPRAEDSENGEAEGRAIIRSVLDNAPDFAIDHLSAAIGALQGDEAVSRAAVDVDF